MSTCASCAFWVDTTMWDEVQAVGMPRELLEPMLDARQLGAWWEGSAFTMGRLT